MYHHRRATPPPYLISPCSRVLCYQFPSVCCAGRGGAHCLPAQRRRPPPIHACSTPHTPNPSACLGNRAVHPPPVPPPLPVCVGSFCTPLVAPVCAVFHVRPPSPPPPPQALAHCNTALLPPLCITAPACALAATQRTPAPFHAVLLQLPVTLACLLALGCTGFARRLAWLQGALAAAPALAAAAHPGRQRESLNFCLAFLPNQRSIERLGSQSEARDGTLARWKGLHCGWLARDHPQLSQRS